MAAMGVSIALPPGQLLSLLSLGVLASGLGFVVWNVGATRVTAGALAVMNNAKVPLAVAMALIFFGEQAHLPALLASLGVMGLAVWLAEPRSKAPRAALAER
jgi:drug/metabolite transporter (DMT)-like permease